MSSINPQDWQRPGFGKGLRNLAVPAHQFATGKTEAQESYRMCSGPAVLRKLLMLFF